MLHVLYQEIECLRRGRAANGSLESLRSRVVLLNVWATWCLECRAELRVLKQLHRDYAAQGLTDLALNFREEPGTVRQYARELGLTLPLLVDPVGASAYVPFRGPLRRPRGALAGPLRRVLDCGHRALL
jgi:thiol-disulfide isomerase/thioredoxin